MINNKKQPRGLYLLSFLEIWDRFGYYGIQSILVLFLTKTMLMADDSAYALYGIYTALAFSTPLLGGYIADRFLGYRKAVAYGLTLLTIGNALLFIEGAHTFYIGLSLVICGIGLFKANNATLLGSLYEAGDIKKEKGFTLFYMGMNIGATLGPVVFGLAALYFNWKYGFMLSALASGCSLVLFVFFRQLYNSIKPKTSKKYPLRFCVALICAVLGISGLFYFPEVFKDILWLIGIVSLIYLFTAAAKHSKFERKCILLLVILDLFAIFFFACQIQIGSSLTLFIDRLVNKQVFAWTIPTAAFSALQPICVIISAPLLEPIWNSLGRLLPIYSVILRVFLGLALGGLSFVLFALSADSTAWHTTINYPLIGVVAGNFVLGAGELCIGPIIMAAVSRFAPERLRGQLMGFWFLSIAFASYLGSILAQFAGTANIKLTNNSTIYFHSFLKTSLVTLSTALLLLIFLAVVRRFPLAQITSK